MHADTNAAKNISVKGQDIAKNFNKKLANKTPVR